MSTVYYLVDQEKKKEYDAFIDFWENRFSEEIRKTIENYCSEHPGKYIDGDFAEDAIDSTALESLKYRCPVSSDDYSVRIGSASINGFSWDYVSLDWGSTSIHDILSMEEYLNANPTYAIYDEYNTLISIEEFKEIAGHRRQ